MADLLQPTHLLLIISVAVVLFGAKRLPEFGRGVGTGLREFNDGLKGLKNTCDPALSPRAKEVSGPAESEPLSRPSAAEQ